MKKFTFILIIIGLLIAPKITFAKEKGLVFTYQQPYEYHINDGQYCIWARVENRGDSHRLKMSINDQLLPIKTEANGDVKVSLPLIGDAGHIKITERVNGKKSIRTQNFKPLIPASWDYFANGKIHIIVSSHQDIAWMNSPDSCREERVNDIVIPALDLMDKTDAFKFEMEQSLNLMEVMEDAPENKQRLIDTYKSGNFEWGATFTQPYEGLESGEQLVRQSYLGRKWIKNNLPGMDAIVAYNIDVPGRSLQVPQLFKKSGIDYLFVSRMKEGFYNWYSPDGSSIFTYSPCNYGWYHYHHKILDEGAITAIHELHKILKNWNTYYRDRNIPPHYGVVISADAGGPKYYKDLIEQWNSIANQSGIEMPQIAHSTALEFLHEIDVPEAKIDSIYGERPNLWLYIHGAAHYQAIKAKKEAAVNIPSAEIFSTINSQLQASFKTYPQEELYEAWYNAIYPDHGWGGKNGHITDSLFRVALETGNDIGKKLLNQSLTGIVEKVELKKQRNIIVFNDVSWNRDGYATVDISHLDGNNWIVTAEDGSQVPTQLVISSGKKELVFNVKEMPSIGYKAFSINKGKRTGNDVNAGSNFCHNQFYKIEFGQGGITRLYDKELEKEVFNTSAMLGGDLFHMGYEGSGAGEFVTVTAPHYGNMERAHQMQSQWNLVESGAVYSKFQSAFEMDTFSVVQNITVFHQTKKIDLEYTIPDWPGEHNRQVRVMFPLNMEENAQISYDVPMGMVHVGKDELKMRPGGSAWGGTYRQMPEEIHPREIQNFMTANGSGFGFTMATNVITADWIDPSMNSAPYPVINSILLSTHKSCHWQGPWYHQKGSHTFKFSITTHKEGWKNGFHFGVAQNHPLHAITKDGKQSGELPAQKSFAGTSDPFAIITTIKKAEDDDDVVIRLLEAEGEAKNIKLNFHKGVESISITDMIEENPKKLDGNGKVLNINLGKSAVETYKLKQ